MRCWFLIGLTQSHDKKCYQVSTWCSNAWWRLDWLVGDLCYLCHSICTWKFISSRGDIRNEPAFSKSLWFPLEETKGRWGLGWKLQGLSHSFICFPPSFLFLYLVLWAGCLGGTWKHSGRTNVLGCYVPHVCEISLSRTYRERSSTGYVKATTCKYRFFFPFLPLFDNP